MKPKGKSGTPLVYSSEQGRICPACGQPVAACRCRSARPAAAAAGPVRVGRETKGRKGKGVTVISGLPLDAATLAELATRLKRRCGSGGTVRDGKIEIQGDHRDQVLAELLAAGWEAKKSGG